MPENYIISECPRCGNPHVLKHDDGHVKIHKKYQHLKQATIKPFLRYDVDLRRIMDVRFTHFFICPIQEEPVLLRYSMVVEE